MGRFVVGLDLGQAADYSALVVLHQHTPPPVVQIKQAIRGDDQMRYTRQQPSMAPQPNRYECPHLERFALGTPYPEIVRQVMDRLATPALRGADLVVDATGCGRPVVDLFRAAGCKLHGVMITAGSIPTSENGYWYVPKRELVSTVQVLLQSERLKIARELAEAQTLTKELLNFQVKITTAANDVYGAWREGTHDDLVLGLAIAAWYAERPLPRPAPPSQSFRTWY